MWHFNQLKQALAQTVENAPDTPDLIQIELTLAFSDEQANFPAWLKAQTEYPQAFWQHREQPFSFTALGATAQFNDLATAHHFAQQHNVTLVGGVQFEGTVRFVLPRLLLVKNAQKLTACCYFFPHEKAEMQRFLAQLAEPQPLQPLRTKIVSKQTAYDFPHWKTHIEQAIGQIRQHAFDKVVLANATTLTTENVVSVYDLLAATQQKNHGCYHFLWVESANQTFLGSSPERLYQRHARRFTTEALAGTVAVTNDPIETEQNALWLLNDHKNLYENWLVVDDICGHLADCTQDIQVGEAQIKRLRNVQHLRREIHTELRDTVGDHDCLARLHPTAAVAGLPREAAKPFIATHEGFSRGWYAGTLGYFNPEQAEFCVTLRSALVQGKQITLYAGAGIVEESDPYSEWQEIERKSEAMLGLFKQSDEIR